MSNKDLTGDGQRDDHEGVPQDGGPDDAIAAAGLLASDAEAVVMANSERRLKELMSFDHDRRIEWLDDPDLIPEHRIALRRSLQARVRPIRFIDRFFRLNGQWLRHWRLLPRVRVSRPLCALALVCGTFCWAAARSDASPGMLNQPFAYTDVDEDGAMVSRVAPSGTPVVVVDQSADQFLARSWLPGVGYATVAVPKVAVTLAEPRTLSWIMSEVSRFLPVLWGPRGRAGT